MKWKSMHQMSYSPLGKFPCQADNLMVEEENSLRGFSLIEAMVSLLVLFAIMAGLIPVFMSWRLTSINNNIKTGAIAISQQILDELRQDNDVSAWDNSNTALAVKPSGESIAAIDYGGRTYSASLTYCAESTYCDTDSRHVTLKVNYNNDTIYTIKTVYTNFD